MLYLHSGAPRCFPAEEQPRWTLTQFTGLLDEIRIWNRPLSLTEIQRNRFMTLAYVSGPYSGVVLSISFQFLAQAPIPYAPQDFSGNDLIIRIRGNVSGTSVGTGPSRKLIPNEAVRFDGIGYLSTPSLTINNFSSSLTLQCWVWPDTIQTGIILQKREALGFAQWAIRGEERKRHLETARE